MYRRKLTWSGEIYGRLLYVIDVKLHNYLLSCLREFRILVSPQIIRTNKPTTCLLEIS